MLPEQLPSTQPFATHVPVVEWLEDHLMWFREGIRCAPTRTHAARINDARTHDHE